jgi:GAF domain
MRMRSSGRAVKLLLQARENTLGWRQSNLREVFAIVRSHDRLTQKSLDPARGAGMRSLSVAELEKRRRESGLAELVPVLWQALHDGDDLQAVTVHDPAGWVLWRSGSTKALRIANSLGLREGACWSEDAVGTNAAGTALIERRGLLCIAHDHYVASHYPFACAATPLHDAWDRRRLLGILNVTTPKKKAHANTLTMVELAAGLVPIQIRKAHDDKLTPLREAAFPTLHRLGTPAVLTDGCGHVVAAQKIALKHPVLPLPTQVSDQPFDCPVLGGRWVVEPFKSGWLWRPAGAGSTPATRVELDVRQPMRWSLTVHRAGTSLRYNLSKRHVEILFLLAWLPAGRTAAELVQDLYGGSATTGTVRSLFSRMRNEFGRELFPSEPYRFGDHLEVMLYKPDNLADLLPFSTAPAICRIRAGTIS